MADFTLTQEQSSIVHADAYRTMLIVAGAGSGKTFTMTERIIELIKQGVGPHKILGLTFTKAAATELSTRVSAAVNSTRARLENEGEDADDVLLDSNADSAFMKPEVYTYDSFFQSIVRQYGLLVGMDPNTTPLSDAGAYQLMDSLIHENLREVLSVLDEENSQDATSQSSSAQVRDDIDDMSSYSTFVSNVLQLSNAISSCMIDKTCTTMDEAVDRIDAWDSAFIGHLDSIIDREYPEEKNRPDFGDKVSLTSAKTQEKFDEWMSKKGREYLAHVLVNLREKTRMRSVYLKYVRLFSQRKRELRVAQFADFTIAAMELVQRFPWIGEQYRSRFSHVFLDEYQDSSTAQASLIIELFAPHSASDNSGANKDLGAAALTAVGDPYQAIYAWRGAAPGAFSTFLKQTGLNSALSLSKTVRNPELVLDVANKLTEPLRAGHYDAYGRKGSVKLNEVSVPELSPLVSSRPGSIAAVAYSSMRQEIDGVVRYAKKAVEKSKKHNDVLIKRGEPARSGPFAAVLLRSKTHMAEFADALNAAGLTVQVDGVQSVMDRPDMHDMLNLLRIVANHSDSTAVLNLLASVRFGIAARDVKAFADAVSRYNADVQNSLLDYTGTAAAERGTWEISPVVSLADVLLAEEKNRTRIFDKYYHGTDGARVRIEDFARQLCQVNSRSQAGIDDVIRSAGEALGLDIDVAVAYAISRAQNLTGEAAPVSSVDSLLELAQAYEQELSQTQTPTLSGFMAWVESANADTVTNPTILGSAYADVIVCTVHHSKGLEWDSVIIPEMNKGTFPSNGSGLGFDAIYEDEPVPFGSYAAHARTWLTDPTAVPSPVRADKDALPYFASEDEFDRTIADAAMLERAVDNALHLPQRESLGDVMSLKEESGQIALQEERRLVYVAITRAKRDVFMTGAVSGSGVMDAYDPVGYVPSEAAESMGKVKLPDFGECSVFLAEANEYLHSSGIGETYGAQNAVDLGDEFADLPFADAPLGIFVGQDAREYAEATVGGALEAARNAHERVQVQTYAHPRRVDERVGKILDESARMSAGTASSSTGESEGPLRAAAERIHKAMAQLGFAHAQDERTHSDEELIRSARAVQSHRNTSVTAIQREIVDVEQSNSNELQRARAIMRPIPSMAQYGSRGELSAANLGTVFHSFAQRYFTPDALETANDADGAFAQSKESIRAELEAENPQGEYEKRMHNWKMRLIASPFSPSDSEGTEVPFAYAVSGSERMVVGVIDAVFRGEQCANSPISRNAHESGKEVLYTVIDWKTGHKPHTPEEVADKLLQVDMYREIWATLRGVDIDQVDAALYYVSEAKEENRLIPAEYKTREQIEKILQGSAQRGERLDNTND